jgi:hypothetical protein
LNGLSDFEKEIQSIKRPDDNGQGCLHSFDEIMRKNQPAHINEAQVKQAADALSREKVVLIPLDTKLDIKNDVINDVPDEAQEQSDYPFDYLARARSWSSRLKTYGIGMPNAIFIGGAREKHYLAVFSRPINMEDFVRLWSALSL